MSIDWDKTLQVGDYVVSNYHKQPLLFQITSLERRFLTKDDLRHRVYADAKEGDEYSSIVQVVAVQDLDIRTSSTKKIRKVTKSLDITWVKRVNKDLVLEQIDKLQELLKLV